jgi:hypothetical protein
LKNQTHVRQLLDQERLEHPEMLDDLNELLKRWDQWRNFFFGRGSGLVGQKDGAFLRKAWAMEMRWPAYAAAGFVG